MAGLIGTLSLHGLVVQATFFGSKLYQHRAASELLAAGSNVPQANPAEELVLLSMADNVGPASDLVAQIASLRPKTVVPLVAVQSLDALPNSDASTADDLENNSSPSTRDLGDPAIRALMFGRYTNQINARIERAWIRPRSPVNDKLPSAAQSTGNGVDEKDYFTCRVQIRQDRRGNVQEVLLLQCNGTESWRRSLVIAINQSSPLPAPPTPSVFAEELTMMFESHPYREGDPADAYELKERRTD